MMQMNIDSMQSIIQSNKRSQLDRTPVFKPGQIFCGKVRYIDPSNHAIIQIGGEKIIANIEAPLDVRKDYWFEVVKTDGTIQLKVLDNISNNDAFLSFLHLPKTKLMNEFLQQWKQMNFSFERNVLTKVADWINQVNDIQKVLEIVQQMDKHHLPMTDVVFQSLLSMKSSSPLSVLIENLYQQLNQDSRAKNLPIVQTLQHLLGKDDPNIAFSLNGSDGNKIHQLFRQLNTLLGMNYEALINGAEMKNLPLKGQLIQLLTMDGLPLPVKKEAEQLFHKIIGTQLVNIESNGLLQMTLSLPLPLAEKVIDANIHWRGKKTEDGKLDPNFCLIIFDLQMPSLGTIVSRMQVQNRTINLYIFCEDDKIEHLSQPFVDLLKENLKKLNYQLAAIKFEKIDANRQTNSGEQNLIPPVQSGSLDVRI